MLETLDHTIRIGSTPTFLYFDLALILGFLFVDFDINITYIMSNKLYVCPMAYLKKSSHNFRLHAYIQKITTPRGYHYKIRIRIQKENDQINKHCQLWIYLEGGCGAGKSSWDILTLPGLTHFSSNQRLNPCR